MPINNVTMDGRLVSEVELRKTSNKGYSVMNLRLAHNDPHSKVPVYIDVEVWGKTAENLEGTAKRGSFVVVHGKMGRDVWEQEIDGKMEKRSKLKIKADKVIVDSSQPTRRDSTESVNVSF